MTRLPGLALLAPSAFRTPPPALADITGRFSLMAKMEAVAAYSAASPAQRNPTMSRPILGGLACR